MRIIQQKNDMNALQTQEKGEIVEKKYKLMSEKDETIAANKLVLEEIKLQNS